MSNEIQTTANHAEIIEKVVVAGDLAALTPEQRVSYYLRVCESLSLDPLTRPFEYLKLDGRLVLYARRDATDQLRRIHGVSIEIVSQEMRDDVYVVVARATTRDGRSDTSTGAVSVAGLKGQALANAIMKAETKAKRRATLSICGLGMLDETEASDIPAPASATAAQDAPALPEVDVETERLRAALKEAVERLRLASVGVEGDKMIAAEQAIADARKAYASGDRDMIGSAIARINRAVGECDADKSGRMGAD